MLNFYEKLSKIKNSKDKDIIKLKYLEKPTSLQIVDFSDETIHLLTKWRKENWDGFNSKFNPTNDSTKQWLKKTIDSKQRLLFLIIYDGKKIGHTGMVFLDEKNDDTIWMENIVKGEPSVAPGVMGFIEKFFLKWIFDEFNVSWVKGYVFSDNARTIRLHEKCGWLTLDSIPLKREFSKDGWAWVKTNLSSPEEYAERYFLLMGKENKDKR